MLPEDIELFERGWLSSNNIVLHDAQGAVLIDTSHVLHAAQTLALLRHALAGRPLARIVNTHLHSDHCGGNATLQRAYGVPLAIPPGQWDAVQRWDEAALSYTLTGQRCERFVPDERIQPGEAMHVGGHTWEAHAAPGHDPHSLILFEPQRGLLISADALWENGFGVVFPELEGEGAFDEVADTLALIERLAPRIVLPGHGAAFADAPGALQRARSRLAAFRADPAKHARHGIKVLIKYHLLEEQSEPVPTFDAWFVRMPMAERAWIGIGRPGTGLADWGQQLVAELCTSGALARRDGMLHNA